MRLVYVFNYRETQGYVCRVPKFVALLMCKVSRKPWDYCENVNGYSSLTDR